MKVTDSKGNPIDMDKARGAVKMLASTDPVTRDKAFAAVQTPIRRKVEKESSARRIYETAYLSDQEDAIFPLDTEDEVEVVLASAYGIPPISMFMTGVVTINTDTYQGGWELPEQLAKAGRIDQVRRNSRRMAEGFISKEEATAWSAITASASEANTVEVEGTGAGSASIELINEMLIYFQDRGYVPTQCWMSPRSMGDIRMLCKEAGFADQVRFDLWKNGMLPGLWNIDFYAMRGLPDDKLYMFDTSRFGIMAIRQDIETREDPAARAQFKIRVYGQAQYGWAVTQKDALCVGSFTRGGS
mgnify:CR=1 FL=1